VDGIDGWKKKARTRITDLLLEFETLVLELILQLNPLYLYASKGLDSLSASFGRLLT
jgi:hypothetical protein